jgi:hypothetical protein
MRKTEHNWLHRLGLAWLLFIATIGHATEPRLMQLFRKLEAGAAQTVVVYGTSLTLHGEWALAMQNWFATNYPGQVTSSTAAAPA